MCNLFFSRRQWSLPSTTDRGSSTEWNQPSLWTGQRHRLRLRPRCQNGPAGCRSLPYALLQRLLTQFPPETNLERGRCCLLNHRLVPAGHCSGGKTFNCGEANPRCHFLLLRDRLGAVLWSSQVPSDLNDRHLDPFFYLCTRWQGGILFQLWPEPCSETLWEIPWWHGTGKGFRGICWADRRARSWKIPGMYLLSPNSAKRCFLHTVPPHYRFLQVELGWWRTPALIYFGKEKVIFFGAHVKPFQLILIWFVCSNWFILKSQQICQRHLSILHKKLPKTP